MHPYKRKRTKATQAAAKPKDHRENVASTPTPSDPDISQRRNARRRRFTRNTGSASDSGSQPTEPLPEADSLEDGASLGAVERMDIRQSIELATDDGKDSQRKTRRSRKTALLRRDNRDEESERLYMESVREKQMARRRRHTEEAAQRQNAATARVVFNEPVTPAPAPVKHVAPDNFFAPTARKHIRAPILPQPFAPVLPRRPVPLPMAFMPFNVNRHAPPTGPDQPAIPLRPLWVQRDGPGPMAMHSHHLMSPRLPAALLGGALQNPAQPQAQRCYSAATEQRLQALALGGPAGPGVAGSSAQPARELHLHAQRSLIALIHQFHRYDINMTVLHDCHSARIDFKAIPWPVLGGSLRQDDINLPRVRDFMLHPLRLQGTNVQERLTRDMQYWDEQQFVANVLPKVVEDQRAAVAVVAARIAFYMRFLMQAHDRL